MRVARAVGHRAVDRARVIREVARRARRRAVVRVAARRVAHRGVELVAGHDAKSIHADAAVVAVRLLRAREIAAAVVDRAARRDGDGDDE